MPLILRAKRSAAMIEAGSLIKSGSKKKFMTKCGPRKRPQMEDDGWPAGSASQCQRRYKNTAVDRGWQMSWDPVVGPDLPLSGTMCSTHQSSHTTQESTCRDISPKTHRKDPAEGQSYSIEKRITGLKKVLDYACCFPRGNVVSMVEKLSCMTN